ncbi:hypothetical protein EAG_06874 [Camponotus floridanus]|uniref:Uncharacterized protein n=2 Tax=Camponotus floridanus TaxID=104421 RepID=E2A1L6_CAMFO|nr:hypothetical protein EAG_06874 [Camponotus floridanus]
MGRRTLKPTRNENKKVFELASIRSWKLKIKAQKTFNPKKIDSKKNETLSKDKLAWINVHQLFEEILKNHSQAKLDTEKKTIKKDTNFLITMVASAEMNTITSKVEHMQLE